jgi:tRNA pseudouridine55 synthase
VVELPEREVEVRRFDELWRDGDRRGFVIECSSGTYIRSLIADLGHAYTEALRRTAIGDFQVSDADPDRSVPLADALGFLPGLELDAEQAEHIRYGRAISAPEAPAGTVRLTHAGELVALAQPGPGADELRPVLGLSRPSAG